MEHRAFRDDASSGIDTALSGNRASGEDVVSGTRLDGDTHVMVGGDSLADTNTKGIVDTGDGHQGDVAGEVLIGNLIGGMEFGTGGGPVLKIPVAECDGPQHLVCVEGDCP